jgi:hypothetical protein
MVEKSIDTLSNILGHLKYYKIKESNYFQVFPLLILLPSLCSICYSLDYITYRRVGLTVDIYFPCFSLYDLLLTTLVVVK